MLAAAPCVLPSLPEALTSMSAIIGSKDKSLCRALRPGSRPGTD
jgi:hypothetical protein